MLLKLSQSSFSWVIVFASNATTPIVDTMVSLGIIKVCMAIILLEIAMQSGIGIHLESMQVKLIESYLNFLPKFKVN